MDPQIYISHFFPPKYQVHISHCLSNISALTSNKFQFKMYQIDFLISPGLFIVFSFSMVDICIFPVVHSPNLCFYCTQHTSWLYNQHSLMLLVNSLLPPTWEPHSLSLELLQSTLLTLDFWSSLNRQASTLWQLHTVSALYQDVPHSPKYICTSEILPLLQTSGPTLLS